MSALRAAAGRGCNAGAGQPSKPRHGACLPCRRPLIGDADNSVSPNLMNAAALVVTGVMICAVPHVAS